MKTLVLCSSELNMAQRCTREWFLSMLEGYSPLQKSEALEKGDLLHQILAGHYRMVQKKNLTIVLQEVKLSEEELAHLDTLPTDTSLGSIIDYATNLGRYAAIKLDLPEDVSEEVITQYQAYARFNAGENWIPLVIERPFSRVLFEREDTSEREGLTILYEGKLDLQVLANQKKYTVDHKSRGRNPSTMPRAVASQSQSNQFMGYCWAFDTSSIIINGIGFQKTLEPKERFRRNMISYDQSRLEEWVSWSVHWANQLDEFHTQNFYPPNLTSCDKFGGCIFAEVCATTPDAREHKLKMQFEKRPGGHDHFGDLD